MAEATVVVACPQCASKLKLKGDVAGKKVKCPKCEAVFRIGSTATAPSKVPPAAKAEETTRPSAKSIRSKPGQAAAGKKNATGPSAETRPAAKKKRKKKRRSPDRERAEEAFDDSAADPYGLDDFGSDFDDYSDDYSDHGGFDDGYGDYGATDSLPSRRTKKKKKSQKKKSGAEEGSLQDTIHRLGFPGWVLCGGAASLVCIFLTTLTGYTDSGFLTSIMSIVTGAAVGGAVRFAAAPTQGWGPGIVGVVIALVAIIVGKTGSFYVWFGHTADPEDQWTLRDEVEEATRDQAMINTVALEVQQEWLADGKITEAQIEQHWENAFADEEGFDEEFDDASEEEAEDEMPDYASDHLPEIWTEATARWQARTDEEKQKAKDDVVRQIKIDWIGEEAADMDMAEAEKLSQQNEQQGTLALALIFALGNCFLPLHALFCFGSGLFGAFKLASNLGTDD